ncbi:MAG: SGNH/GDSL hydrolase family protein [Lentisphaerae bacterium]|nr:SGNH/GDSL hydrolase family protein [Lentisphaerota bacterium]
MRPTHRADNPGFNYYGRWQRGSTAITINSGSLVEFAYTGHACTLLFDVEGFAQFPAIFVQVDSGPVHKTTLSRTVCSVAVTPAHNGVFDGCPPSPAVCSDGHIVRWWVGTHSLYLMPEAGRQWTTLVGGCKFRGVALAPAASLLALPYGARQIEFLGDSLTQGLRLLYTGVDDDTGQQLPYANWPQLVADLLGLKPVVTGFGGQGIGTPGTCGVPPAGLAFPYVHAGARWVAPVPPEIVVVYQATNDGLKPADFQAGYAAFLAQIRACYPMAELVAICPHNQSRYVEAIRQSATGMHEARVHALDYAAGVIAPADTVDGCHLNPGGAVKLAIRVATDLQRLRATR